MARWDERDACAGGCACATPRRAPRSAEEARRSVTALHARHSRLQRAHAAPLAARLCATAPPRRTCARCAARGRPRSATRWPMSRARLLRRRAAGAPRATAPTPRVTCPWMRCPPRSPRRCGTVYGSAFCAAQQHGARTTCGAACLRLCAAARGPARALAAARCAAHTRAAAAPVLTRPGRPAAAAAAAPAAAKPRCCAVARCRPSRAAPASTPSTIWCSATSSSSATRRARRRTQPARRAPPAVRLKR